jgi:hypothetical protein
MKTFLRALRVSCGLPALAAASCGVVDEACGGGPVVVAVKDETALLDFGVEDGAGIEFPPGRGAV